jgi:hypothetical protein
MVSCAAMRTHRREATSAGSQKEREEIMGGRSIDMSRPATELFQPPTRIPNFEQKATKVTKHNPGS